jgi:hypothetical protein
LGPHATFLQKAKLLERANGLHRKIDNWRLIQAIYTPAVSTLLLRADKATPPGTAAELPQDIELLLPSDLCSRGVTFDRRLADYEWRFRYAQAQDTLDELRNHLRVRSHLWKKKRRDIRGVAANTQPQALLSRQQAKINASARKYRVTRQALVNLAEVLEKDGWECSLLPLKAEDVKGLPGDEEALKAFVGKGKEKAKKIARLGEGKREISWIWTNLTAVAQASDDPGLHDGAEPIHPCMQVLTHLKSSSD